MKIVITSRELLRIRGERVFAVVPLALPGRVDDLNVRGLAGFSAVELFVERAKAVQLNFQLTAENSTAVAAVCARLDGLPLAIEIAAAQMAILQPEEILKHLTGRSLLESRGMVDSDQRHRSLNAAIEWSYYLLDDERGIAMCLEKLGGIAIAQTQLEFAARLLGAAEALREARNTPVEGMDAADYQSFLVTLHEQLPLDMLQRAWHDGQHLPLSHLIEQILES